jgi:hypothetical protein
MRQFWGYGDSPSDTDVQFGEQALAELRQSQSKLLDVFNALITRCGRLLDDSLQNTINASNSDIDQIQAMFNEFLQGGLEISTITDAVNGHVIANDALVNAINAYGCETVVTTSGATRGGAGTTGGGGGASSGGGGGGGGGGGASSGGGGGTTGVRPVTPYTPPGPVQAGLGSLGWLGALAVVGYIIYDKYYKKGTKKGRSKRTTRKMPVRRRRA